MSETELTKGPNEDAGEHVRRYSTVRLPRSEDNMTEADLLATEAVISVYLVLFSVVIDILGVSMVTPILPYYAESFGADASQLGFLYSAFSAAAVVSTLLMGTLSDIFGRRALIIVSLLGSSSGFLFHGLCDNYDQLLAARIYTGFFSSSMTISQAYIADVVPGPLQPKYMANLGAASGMAWMVGPTIGGAITAAANNDFSVPYYVSASIAGMGMLFAIFKLKEPIKRDHVSNDMDEDGEQSTNMTEEETFVQEILKSRLFGFPVIVYTLGIVRFCSLTGFVAHQSMFGLFVIEKYGVSAVFLATMMMVGSICFVFTNMTLFKFILAKFELVNTASFGMIIMGTGKFLYSVPGSEGIANRWLTFCCFWLMLIGYALYMPSMSSLFAKFTTPHERGKILGCGSVFRYAAEIIGPSVFGFLYRWDVNFVWYVAAISLFTGSILIQMINASLRKKKKRWLRKKVDEKVIIIEDKTAVEEEWVYEKDKPYIEDDYTELGKRVGGILSYKNWRWKMKMHNVERVIEHSFPHIPEEVFTNRRLWDHFWEYNTQIWSEVSLIYRRRDQGYMLAQSQNWDFSVMDRGTARLSTLRF